jgi:hypothetical protein
MVLKTPMDKGIAVSYDRLENLLESQASGDLQKGASAC